MPSILSLGWGVQSFTLAAMSALGEIDGLDVAIHSDTTHERTSTYEFAKEWTPWLIEKGLRVVTVNDPTQPQKVTTLKTDIPAFTLSESKTGGMLRRQCTHRWKVMPIRRWLRKVYPREKIEQWLGISLDEFKRMRISDVKYIDNRYPLVEKMMTRWDCVRWLQERSLAVPDRSSCVFCPYHDVLEWQGLAGSEDWSKVVQVDTQIRKARPPYDLFLHQNRKPITEVDLRTPQEKGQLSMWDEECAGVCNV